MKSKNTKSIEKMTLYCGVIIFIIIYQRSGNVENRTLSDFTIFFHIFSQ